MPEATTYHNALPLQSMLLEYRLEAVLGAGGFGMTYLGRDTHLEKHVAIKEYLPTDLVVRALELALPDEAPGSDHVGNDVYLQRFVAHTTPLQVRD